MSLTFYPGVEEINATRVTAGCTPVLYLTNSVGGYGKREIFVEITPSPTVREYTTGGVTTEKYYREYKKVTDYNVQRTSPPTTYTRTITEEVIWVTGWHSYVLDVVGGTSTTVNDTSTTPSSDTGWNPSNPVVSFGAPTITETATSVTAVSQVTSSGYTGTRTITETWLNEVTEASLRTAATDLVPATLAGYKVSYDWLLTNYLYAAGTWTSVANGLKQLGIVEYQIGSVCCRNKVSGTELVMTNIDGTLGETKTPTLYDCTTVIDTSTETRSSAWTTEQPKYRNDDKQVFSEWRRLSPLTYGTTANLSIVADLYLVPYAGHSTTHSGGYCSITATPPFDPGNEFLTPPQ